MLLDDRYLEPSRRLPKPLQIQLPVLSIHRPALCGASRREKALVTARLPAARPRLVSGLQAALFTVHAAVQRLRNEPEHSSGQQEFLLQGRSFFEWSCQR